MLRLRISLSARACLRRRSAGLHRSSGPMAIQSINPATGELLRSYTPLTEAAIQEKISLAHEAFLKHSQTPLGHRELCMRKLAHLLEAEVVDLAALITAEM